MFAVAPLAGAWIEIYTNFTIRGARIVAPLAGAWIEIGVLFFESVPPVSLPSRERGLKS